jgi:hypothetical protein
VRIVFVALFTLALGGCVTTEDRMAALEHADDQACRAQPSVPYDTCRNMRNQYRMMAAQAQLAQLQGMGTAMQQAGAYLQAPYNNMPPPPPIRQPTHCSVIGNSMTCF